MSFVPLHKTKNEDMSEVSQRLVPLMESIDHTIEDARHLREDFEQAITELEHLARGLEYISHR